MEKPDVDVIEGLSPAISIEQKATSHNPRSTVGTITEIYDYFTLIVRSRWRPALPRPPRQFGSTNGESDGGSNHGAARG